MDNLEKNYTVMSKKEINSYRHKSERRWYRGMVILNFLIIFIIIAATLGNMNSHKKYFRNLEKDFNSAQTQFMDELNEEMAKAENAEDYADGNTDGSSSEEIKNSENADNNDESSDEEESDGPVEKLGERIEKFPEDIKLTLTIIVLMIFIPLAVSYVYAMYRSMSIKVTEKNFPEIYEIVKEYTERLGLKRMPNVYIIQGNGVLNAFSSCIPFKQYVELFADLVEVGYREHNDMDALRFIIAHEMVHIKLKHATLHYNMLMLFSNYIPILSSTASRAREYSCDRIAQHLAGNDGIDAIMTLMAGKHLYKKVDKEEYLRSAKEVNGFFVWWYNLLADHPINTKRIQALEMKEGSGKLY